MAGMAELRTQPDPNALSATQARRMIAARPGGGIAQQRSLAMSQGQNPMGMKPPTPQMRGPTGQMGPAVPGVGQPSLPLATGGGLAQKRSLMMQQGINPMTGQRVSGQPALQAPQQGWRPSGLQQAPPMTANQMRMQYEQRMRNQSMLPQDVQARQLAMQGDQYARQQFEQQKLQQDRVPAMLAPGEAVIPRDQTDFLQQQGLLDNALGMEQQQLEMDAWQRQLMTDKQAQMGQSPQFLGALGAQQYNPAYGQYGTEGARSLQPQHFATGGVVPDPDAQGQQPSVSPQPSGMQGQVAQARSLAMSRGVNPMQGPTPTSAGGALAQARSLAASGGVSPTSGQPSTPPGQPSSGPTPPTTQPPGYDYAGLRKDIQGFGPAPALDESTMARMRAQQDDRLRRQYEANVSELGASAASSGALFGGDVRQLAAGFAAERGRQMSDFELGLDTKALDQGREDYYKQFDAATGLASQRAGFQQQTSERLGGQAYGSEEQQKQRAFVGDENAKNRLAQVAAQEKNIAAQQASLQAQIKAAADQGDLNRANALQLQLAPLAQQAAEMKQQNEQFLAGIGLDRERFEEAASQFDLTRQDGVNQFAQNLDLQNRQMTQQGSQFNAQLAQSLAIANMDDQTRRWVTQLQADMNNPTEFQTALSALGTIASIPGLGERIFGGIGGLFGGSGSGQTNTANAGNEPWWGTGSRDNPAQGATGGMSNAATAGIAALAAGGAAALIDKAFEPGSSEWWDVAAGQVMGGALGAAFGGIVGFGRDAQQAAQEKFTTAFDKAYQGLEQGGFLQKPPTDPQSFWNPAVRASVAKGFEKAVAESAKIGTSAQEISEPDWQRMERLGLGAVVNGTDRSRHYLVDDPRITAILGKDATSDWLTFELAGRNDDTNYSQLGGSLKKMIERGGVTVRDKKTGEIIDLNNAEQLKAIAARNGGAQ